MVWDAASASASLVVTTLCRAMLYHATMPCHATDPLEHGNCKTRLNAIRETRQLGGKLMQEGCKKRLLKCSLLKRKKRNRIVQPIIGACFYISISISLCLIFITIIIHTLFHRHSERRRVRTAMPKKRLVLLSE